MQGNGDAFEQAINAIIDGLESGGSSHNFLFVDACRESSDKGTKGVDGSTIQNLSSKMTLLFSAKSGQRSYESAQLQQGIFTHYLLEGLRGEAADKRGQITSLGLITYVTTEVTIGAPTLLDSDRETDPTPQEPNAVNNSTGFVVLGRKAAIRASETLKKNVPADFSNDPTEFTNSVGMLMKRIPKGEFLMGSPESEVDYSGKHAVDEKQHRVAITQDFYMGECDGFNESEC